MTGGVTTRCSRHIRGFTKSRFPKYFVEKKYEIQCSRNKEKTYEMLSISIFQ